jgi:hypothetical protein
MSDLGACGVETTSAFPSIPSFCAAGGVCAELACGSVISVHALSADIALEVDHALSMPAFLQKIMYKQIKIYKL